MKKKILLALLALLILIQFIPMDRSNPESDPQQDMKSFIYSNLPKESAKMDLHQYATQLILLNKVCYDCHSHKTEYPLYSRIQPLGWWLRSHVRGGRMKVNYSQWGTYTANERRHKAEESIEVLKEGRMPLKSYTWMHPESKMTKEEKQELVDLFSKISSI